MSGGRRVPGALWLFVVGFAVCSVVPLLPWLPYLPANPVAVFAVAAAVNLMWRRDKKSYWATVAIAIFALWYPAFVLPSWLTVSGPPDLVEGLWVFLTPALLTCLLFSPEVRRYAVLDESGQEMHDELSTLGRR